MQLFQKQVSNIQYIASMYTRRNIFFNISFLVFLLEIRFLGPSTKKKNTKQNNPPSKKNKKPNKTKLKKNRHKKPTAQKCLWSSGVIKSLNDYMFPPFSPVDTFEQPKLPNGRKLYHPDLERKQ